LKRVLFLLAWLAIPATAQDIPFSMFTLPNGLRVILSPDDAVPVVSVALITPVGSRQESPGRAGFAHLFEHLTFTGSKNLKKGQLDRLLEANGAEGNAETWSDYTIYYTRTPANATELALWLDADRFGGLKVSRRALRNQVAVVKEEKRLQVYNEPYGRMMWVDVTSASYTNWQNRHDVYGGFEDLDAARLADVRQFFAEHYAPANMALAVVGDFEPVKMRKTVARLFGWIPNNGRPQAVDLSEPEQTLERVVPLRDEHAKVNAVGFTYSGMPKRDSRYYYAMTLLGRYLFEGKSARLYQALVKREQIASSISTPWSGGLGFPAEDWQSYREPGLLGGVILLKGNTGHAMARAIIQRELRATGLTGISEADLRRVKTKFRADWIRARETTLGRARALLNALVFDGDPAAANSHLERFMSVTPEEFKAASLMHVVDRRSTFFYLTAEGK
jgi:zinc protease